MTLGNEIVDLGVGIYDGVDCIEILVEIGKVRKSTRLG